MSLWTAAQVKDITSATPSGNGDWSATGVAIDAQRVTPGDLFIAMDDAALADLPRVKAAGAVAALVEHLPAGNTDLPLLQVASTAAALSALARAGRERAKARIVVVAGAIGKSGTIAMLAEALAEHGAAFLPGKRLTGPRDIALALARLPADAAFALLELGPNRPGTLTPLAALVRPHVTIVTNVEPLRGGAFASPEQAADAKAEIFAGVEAGGAAILNRDGRHFRRLANAAKAAGIATVLSFGDHIDADARLLDCAIDPDDTAVFTLLRDKAIAYRVGLTGRQWALNSLAALLAALVLGRDVDLAARALAGVRPAQGAGRRHRVAVNGGSVEVIDESASACPASMQAAIATLAAARPAKGGRRIAVLGDMADLGKDSAALHAGLAQAVLAWNIDLVHTAGPLSASLREALPADRRGLHAAGSDELAPLVKAQTKAGDVLMVKGSADSRMGRVVEIMQNGGSAEDAL